MLYKDFEKTFKDICKRAWKNSEKYSKDSCLTARIEYEKSDKGDLNLHVYVDEEDACYSIRDLMEDD